VTEQFLHGSDVLVVLQQVRGERMAEHVTGRALGQTSRPNRFLDRWRTDSCR
jgi:hypothetical protein